MLILFVCLILSLIYPSSSFVSPKRHNKFQGSIRTFLFPKNKELLKSLEETRKKLKFFHSTDSKSFEDLALKSTRNSENKETTPPTKKYVYQRAEDWDREMKSRSKLSWEEKVQWEGLQNGNRFRQNEILTKHLKY